MKKRILIALVAVIGLVGCQKKVDLKSEAEGLNARAMTQMEAATTMEEQEAAISLFVDSMYILLDEHMGEPYSDTLFVGVSYLLTPEQKQALFAKMPKEMLEQEEIAAMHTVFLKETATSEGNPYTDFTALQPNGDELSLSELVGKTEYVLVDFWASWCGPCRRLIPVLKEVYMGQPEGKLQIFSCSVDRDEVAWRKALEEENMPWPQVREDDELYPCSDKYGVTSIPTTILIDKEGNIIARNPDEAELEKIFFGK